jgi:hypothetical protein
MTWTKVTVLYIRQLPLLLIFLSEENPAELKHVQEWSELMCPEFGLLWVLCWCLFSNNL